MSEIRMRTGLHELPADLPVPVDEGAAVHLPGAPLPGLALPSTSGGMVPLRGLASRRAVLFFYPRTGEPGKPVGPGWDAIPGARG